MKFLGIYVVYAIIMAAIFRIGPSDMSMRFTKGPVLTLLIVYFFVTIFNFFVTSGSGKAVMVMPILSPLGNLLNINEQVMVLAYQYGDGFTNFLWPAGAMVCTAICGVDYGAWLKYAWKTFATLIFAGYVLVIIANTIGYGPF